MLCAGIVLASWTPAGAQVVEAQVQHRRGQSVAPIFEGWYIETDGNVQLSFGYLNLNYEEELYIPVGPDNSIKPGRADQGQPTHFLPRRQVGVFTVSLPEDAPETEFVWTLKSAGQTMTVPATLSPLYEIYALKKGGRRQFVSGGLPSDNAPPVLKFAPDGASGTGPRGTAAVLETVFPNPIRLEVWVSDDGLPRQRGGNPSIVTLTFSTYRGPGAVTFGEVVLPVDENTNSATTSATFSEPGEYVLRVLATDGSRFNEQCCWTNGYVTVGVRPPSTPR